MGEGTITVGLIVRNEEENIRECLESVKGPSDEIIVVDGESEDRTREIAREYTNEVYVREPKGYMEAEIPFLLNHIGGEWVFMIDADERASEKLERNLRKLVRYGEKNDIGLYHIPRYMKFNNRLFVRGGVGCPRLFKKDSVRWKARIHRGPELIDGKERRLPDDWFLVHLPNAIFRDAEFAMKRMIRYIKGELRKEKYHRMSKLGLMLKGTGLLPIEVIRRLFIRGYFLRGWRGLYRSVYKAVYKLILYLLVAGIEMYDLFSFLLEFVGKLYKVMKDEIS